MEEFAHPVAALTDHEEMVLGLVHPLVQVYTIPRAGQLAYVGHICNFRQKVTKFLTSLPLLPADMPIVHVQTHKYKGKPGGSALFKVGVTKLRSAFLWLKANNPYYADVEWREEAAVAWAADDVQVGTTREGDDDSGQAVPVTRTCFERWMERTEVEAMGAISDMPAAGGCARSSTTRRPATRRQSLTAPRRRMLGPTSGGSSPRCSSRTSSAWRPRFPKTFSPWPYQRAASWTSACRRAGKRPTR